MELQLNDNHIFRTTQVFDSLIIIKKEKYLLPILLPAGIIAKPRKGMQKTKFYIDDGNMRALAFTSTGDKKIKAFIGSFPKNSN